MRTNGCLIAALEIFAESCLAGDIQPLPLLLDEYKTYSIARCITNNYSDMGVNLDGSNIIDYTMGFIDIEEGYALATEKYNKLDSYIKEKTADLYKPKQHQDDMSKTNLVIYECVDFYKSDDLDLFLRALLETRKQ